MAEFIPVNGKLLTYGLTWVTVANPKNERTERVTLCRTAQADYYVRSKGQDIKYGLARRVIDVIGKQPNGVLVSAASLFSGYIKSLNVAENSVLIQKLTENKVAIIALIQGEPHLDMVVKASDVSSRLTQLAQEVHGHFVEYGNVAAQNVVTPEDLLAEHDDYAQLVCFTDPVKKMRQWGLVAAVVGGIAGLGVWKTIQHQRAAEAAVKNAANPAQIYAGSTRQLLSNANFNGKAAYDTIWSVIKRREIEVAGWSLASLTCHPGDCEEIWKQNYGDYKVFRQTIQPTQTIELHPTGDMCTIRYPLPGKKTALDYATLPKKDDLWVDLLGQQQRLKRILPSLMLTPNQPAILGLTPMIMASSVPTNLLLYGGDVTVSAPLGLAAEMMERHLPHVMISEVSFTNFNDVRHATIKIKGTYYAQN